MSDCLIKFYNTARLGCIIWIVTNSYDKTSYTWSRIKKSRQYRAITFRLNSRLYSYCEFTVNFPIVNFFLHFHSYSNSDRGYVTDESSVGEEVYGHSTDLYNIDI